MTAVLSADGRYRYQLRREISATGHPPREMCFVMLNPSTADAENDDPTVRRCIGFARREACTALEIVNLYAYRATDPADLFRAQRAGVDIVGPRNPDWLDNAVAKFGQDHVLVAAWGANARQCDVRSFSDLVADLNEKTRFGVAVHCLGRTKAGQPRHPLMLRSDTALEVWTDLS